MPYIYTIRVVETSDYHRYLLKVVLWSRLPVTVMHLHCLQDGLGVPPVVSIEYYPRYLAGIYDQLMNGSIIY